MNDRPTDQELRAARQQVKDMIAALEAVEPSAQAREGWEQTLSEAYETGTMLSALLIERGIDRLRERLTRLEEASNGNG